MKRIALILLLIVGALCIFGACDTTGKYEIISPADSYTVTVGDTVDFEDYFLIKNTETGETFPATDEMISAPKADLSKAGAFTVTCSYEDASTTIIFVVQASSNSGGNGGTNPPSGGGENGGTNPPSGGGESGGEITPPDGGETTTPAELLSVFEKYEDDTTWNFNLSFTSGSVEYGNVTYTYGYDGWDCWMTYTDEDDVQKTDYLIYTDDDIILYSDNGQQVYTSYSYFNNEDTFLDNYYFDYLDLTQLATSIFTLKGDHYEASTPATVGINVLGDFQDGSTYVSFHVYVSGGNLAKIVAVQDDGYTFTLTFSNHGNVTVTAPSVNGGNQGGGDEGEGGDGGETNPPEGGDGGGEVTPPTTSDITTTFTGVSNGELMCNADGLEFISSKTPDAFDKDHTPTYGLKFNKSGGEVTLSTVNQLNGVTAIVLNVSANKKAMAVSVSVGGTQMVCEQAGSVLGSFVELTFTSDTALNGVVCITLTPSATTNSPGSMYILQIVVSGTDSGNAGGGSTPDGGATSNMMPTQTYDASSHDDLRLNDKIKEYYQSIDEIEYFYAGLPTTGTFNVLVVPVQFNGGRSFSQTQLANLEIAFNGTEEQTGWESVKTYYQKASYGKLNMSFDIQSVFTASENATYYKEHISTYTYENGETKDYFDGTDILLDEVLAWLDSSINFSNYNKFNDGCIDAVYLIYCEEIDYRYADEIPEEEINPGFFWAYVTWSLSEKTFDSLYPCTYMFAGVDFATEDIGGNFKVNATTYIHETGHALGLDDYYDYNLGQGSDQGLGCADMMDYTIGDHNPYSKIMLGWITPTIVTSAQEIDLYAHSEDENGGVVMLLLDYDGTYFSEYLLIEFYSNTGLNAFHSSSLYDGAESGVRIYHVSSSCNSPYGDNYGSFTDNNNSMSAIPLITLVEADGDSNFETNYDEYADADDLWQAGDKFSECQEGYARNDGKLVNFDIEIVEVVDGVGATISITFLTA